MKLILLSAIFATLLVLASSKCYSNDECSEGSCCIKISHYIGAQCRPLAKENEDCDFNPPVNGQHTISCPCADGMTCEVTEVYIPPGITKYYPRCKRL
uniref:U80-Liphistoxin-Lsp1a_1 n=2 Tax=Liphistius sp. SGP-2016 TaxID=1905180 RepID=A0A4Q8K1U6_9ARAC